MILEKFINPIFSYFKTEAQFFNKFVGFFVGKFDELKFSRYIFDTTHRLYLAQKSLAFLILPWDIGITIYNSFANETMKNLPFIQKLEGIPLPNSSINFFKHSLTRRNSSTTSYKLVCFARAGH